MSNHETGQASGDRTPGRSDFVPGPGPACQSTHGGLMRCEEPVSPVIGRMKPSRRGRKGLPRPDQESGRVGSRIVLEHSHFHVLRGLAADGLRDISMVLGPRLRGVVDAAPLLSHRDLAGAGTRDGLPSTEQRTPAGKDVYVPRTSTYGCYVGCRKRHNRT